MKTSRSLLVFAVSALWVVFAQAQTIRVANNNTNAPDGDEVYSTLQGAINAAVDGDIIHVIGSPISYGNIDIAKRLTIYGIGMDPDKEIPVTSLLGGVNLRRDASGDGSGTILDGLWTEGTISFVNEGVGDVAILRCHTRTIGESSSSYDISGLLIANCVIQSASVNFGSPGSDRIIRNNVFANSSINADNALISNNVFHGTSGDAIGDSDHCVISNNIFFGMDPGTSQTGDCVYNNNITAGDAEPSLPPAGEGSNSGTGNLEGVDPLFVSFPGVSSSTWSPNHDLRLQDASPGKNEGTDDTDIGVYGGTTPFNPAVPLPIIQEFTTDGVIKQGDDLNVTVKAKAN